MVTVLYDQINHILQTWLVCIVKSDLLVLLFSVFSLFENNENLPLKTPFAIIKQSVIYSFKHLNLFIETLSSFYIYICLFTCNH